MGLRFSSWRTALIGIVIIKAVLSLAVKPGSFLVSYSGISYFLLLLLATTLAIRNGIQNALGSRIFWFFLATGYGLWALNQYLQLHYELVLHIEVPQDSISDPLLFLHIVPLMAVVTAFPSRDGTNRMLSRVVLESCLLLFFWTVLYAYMVFPYQYLHSTSSYGPRFDILYLSANLALVLAAGILALRLEVPWKQICLHLFGASVLYSIGSAVANLAIDSGGYVNGKLYGLCLTASACWFVWIPLQARHVTRADATLILEDGRGTRPSLWAMAMVVMISIPIAWELLERNENAGLRTLRLFVAVAIIVCFASAAYIKEYLARREMASTVGLANDRLGLAMKAGTSMGWDLDVASGGDVLFGDLETIFGIPGERHAASLEEFISFVHPDDRQRVSGAIAEARQNRAPYSQEFRILRSDGTIRWLTARGKFYFSANGVPVRMVGVSVDLTDRVLVEDRLREYERAVEGSEDMIAVVDREYRYLIANRKFLKMRNMTREQVVGRFAHEVLNRAFFETIARSKLDECFHGKVVTYETKYTYPEIGERDLLISYFPIATASGIDRAACIMHDITDRKRSEESLRDSEQRFRLAAQAGKMYSFEWDVRTDEVVRSPEHAKVLGITQPLRSTHQQFVQKIHSDDRPRFIATIAGLTPENPAAEVIYRVQSSDDGFVWLRSSGRAFFDREGKLLRVVGMVADITDLKRAEEALSGMTRKLVEAQEQERARIARDLHDDIGQRLALLAIELEQLQENRSDFRDEVVNRIRELRQRTAEISADVHSLSHELHSTGLEYLGAVAGIKSWCKEFGERQRMQIDFRSAGVSGSVPSEIGLCLFRVLQEALHNAAVHSGVKRAEVQLLGESGEIHLIVSDLGNGFDVEAGTQGPGLGLTSMQERVRLVNGMISIESKPMSGTTIHVRVPQVLDERQCKQGA
jgi:PAS domain S-box-containing protein